LAVDRDLRNFDFLADYFSDTRSECVTAAPEESLASFRKYRPGYVFADFKGESSRFVSEFLTGISGGPVRIFGAHIPDCPESVPVIRLESPYDLKTFQPVVFSVLPFPEILKVLTIDDDRDICEGIQDFLSFRKGPSFRVESASNGLEGFRKIESFRPDVTILDIKMPVKNGIDLCREIRRKNPDLRMIVLTSTVSADEILELRKSGVPAFAEKGASGGTFPELLNLIKKQWLFS